MLLNYRFKYPTLERVTLNNGKRYYTTPEGNQVSSVTTILSQTGDKSGLENWKAFVGEKKANEISKEASILGTYTHTHLEKFVIGQPRPWIGNSLPIKVQAKKMADQVIEHGMPYVDEVWGSECALYCSSVYAGTTDLIGIHQGDESIIDYKTSSKMKTKSKILDYRDQLAAYAIAHDEMFNTNIKKGVVFMVSRDFQFEQFIFEGLEFEEGKNSWLERLDLFLSQHG